MSPFIWRLPLTNRGRSTALMPGRAQGSGCLDLRSSSAPLSAPTLLHLLSLVGNWRRSRVGGVEGTLAGGREREDTDAFTCMVPLDSPTGTDEQTENSRAVERTDARRDAPCPALLRVFQLPLWTNNGCLVTELPQTHLKFCLPSVLVTGPTVCPLNTPRCSGACWIFGAFTLTVH